VTLKGQADLDCDGKWSTYTRTTTVVNQNGQCALKFGKLTVVDGLE